MVVSVVWWGAGAYPPPGGVARTAGMRMRVCKMHVCARICTHAAPVRWRAPRGACGARWAWPRSLALAARPWPVCAKQSGVSRARRGSPAGVLLQGPRPAVRRRERGGEGGWKVACDAALRRAARRPLRPTHPSSSRGAAQAPHRAAGLGGCAAAATEGSGTEGRQRH